MYLPKKKRKSLFLGHDSMSGLSKELSRISLCFGDAKFTHHSMCMNCWLSKLAITLVLVLVEEQLTPVNSLYFSTHFS